MSLLEGVPEFKRRRRETEQHFWHRVDRETLAVIQQAQFDDKYRRVSTVYRRFVYLFAFLFCQMTTTNIKIYTQAKVNTV